MSEAVTGTIVDTDFLHEAHFTGFSYQSNVYGLTGISNTDGVKRALIAPLRGKVQTIEFQKVPDELKPVAREIEFLFIPEDAEFISIDSIYKSPEEGIVIALSFIKDCEAEKPSYCVNIYYPWEQGSQFNVESISKSFCTIELDIIPYFLSHSQFMTKEGDLESVFLLSCGDNQIHIFREDKDSSVNRWVKQTDQEGFPEFHDLQSVVLWFDSKILAMSRRLTAMGCQNGYMRLCVVCMVTNEILLEKEFEHDSAITCVQLFTPSAVENSQVYIDAFDMAAEHQVDYHLLVTSALEVAVVYSDVMTCGFTKQMLLADSDNFDSTLCACVADIDWDGYNEILIGTYGQELIAYKYKEKSNIEKKDTELPSNLEDVSESRLVPESRHEYECLWRRSFAHPLLAVNYMDLTGDGLGELVVLSTKGVHILQHNLALAAETLIDKISMEEQVQEDAYM